MNLEVLAEVDAILSHVAALPAVRGATHANDVLSHYDEVDAILVAKGFPPTSPWWIATIRRWYKSGKRQLVGRCGRRGGKSSTLSRLGVVEAVYGHHDVPPSDTGVVAIISTNKGEAADRLTTIRAILDALSIAYEPWGGGVLGIRLVGRRIGFRVFTASIAGVSGFTSIFVIADEVAKWKDADTGVNPANEVIKSVRPTMATMRNARIVLSSSPFSVLDAHYDAFELGETDLQIIAAAKTWEANPTLTEAETRVLEPDESTWLREYGNVPQEEVESSLLDASDLVVCTRKKHPGDLPRVEGWRYVAAMDPATRTNAWTLVVAGQGPKGVRHVVLARQWVPRRGKPLRSENVLREIKDLIAPYGPTVDKPLRTVHTDQAGTDNLRAILRVLKLEDRLVLVEEPWTQATKAQGYELVRKLAQSKRLGLPDDKMVRVDLLGIVKKITRNGVLYQLIERDGRHSDYAPAIAMAVADARYPAKHPTPPKTEQQKADDAKSEFLAERKRAGDRQRKFGTMPVTHRMRKSRAA